MWQRLQTIFLALVIIIMVVSIFMPLWRYVDAGGVRYELYPLHYSVTDGDVKTPAYFPYAITAMFMAAAATLAAMAIRRYDSRITQIKLVALNTLILVGVMICAVYFSYKLNDQFDYVGMSRGAMWTIFGAVACNWVALRFIRRDEKIVRDSDRLR
jgi:hypothetical protein